MAFVKLVEAKDVPLGQGVRVEVGDEEIAVFHTADGFHAIGDICSHAQASLAEGELEGEVVVCPRHGGRFDVTSGKAVGMPAYAPVPTFPLKVEDGAVFVDVES